MYNKNLILVGSIVGVHGLKGYLKVKSFLENPKDIFKFDKYIINDLYFTSLIFKYNKKSIFICELIDVNSLEEAKLLISSNIFICRSLLPKIESDETYFIDLINYNVVLESGLNLGKLIKFYDFGAGPIIEVKNGEKKKMLPFSESFIINIDKNLSVITLSSNIKTLYE